jgi:hypothetical protein
MPKGWLYNWVGMARRKQNPEALFVESFFLLDAQKTAPAPIRC